MTITKTWIAVLPMKSSAQNAKRQPVARWNSFTKGNEIQFSGIPVEQVDKDDLVNQFQDQGVKLAAVYSDLESTETERESYSAKADESVTAPKEALLTLFMYLLKTPRV